MKNILLTNDDGYDARGIFELRTKLAKRMPHARIIVVAPLTQKSACSHSLTIHKPLRLKKIAQDYYALDDGTPADCVYVALSHIFEESIDLVISGVNCGANMGEDITYSGTCAGAMEAALHGIKAIASSLYYKDDSIEKYGFDLACELTCDLATRILEFPPNIPNRQFLNLNIPAVSKADFKGIKVTKTGQRFYDTKIDVRIDPRGHEYIWLGEPDVRSKDDKNDTFDIGAVFDGWASLTPVKLDMCAGESINELENWVK